MKRILILILTKIIAFILFKIQKNSDLPGLIALKLDRAIISYFTLPQNTIFVSGTNIKSAVANNIYQIYTKEGYNVAENAFSSNHYLGVLTYLIKNSNLFGKIKPNILVLKVDTLALENILSKLTPSHLIVTNLSREQSMITGHFEETFIKIKNNIKEPTKLILNADDPLVFSLSLHYKGNITYFGIENNFNNQNTTLDYDDNLDFLYCPICDTKLIYEKIFYNNIGHYHCPQNHYTRPTPQYPVTIDNQETCLINQQKIKLSEPVLYHVYNLAATYTLLKEQVLIDNEKIINHLNNIKDITIEKYQHHNKNFFFPPTKTTNPVSYYHILDYISKQKTPITLVIGYQRLSNEYIENDVSWLWDVKFELINNDYIKNIICLEKYAYDIALRLKYANFNPDRITIIKNEQKFLKNLDEYTSENIYFLTCDNLTKKFKKKGK